MQGLVCWVRVVLSLRPLVTGSHLFAVLFGSTVDTFHVSLQRLVEGALLGQGVLALRCATTGAAVPQLQFLRSLTPCLCAVADPHGLGHGGFTVTV